MSPHEREENCTEEGDIVEQKEVDNELNNDVDVPIQQGERRKFRMVALDLDGTLLGPDHQVSDETVRHLNSLHSRGFIVSIATGRSASCTYEHVRRLNLPYPAADDENEWNTVRAIQRGFPVVCSNGAMGIQLQTQPELRIVTEIFYEPVPREVTLRTIQLSRELGYATQYYHGNDIYVHGMSDEQGDLIRRYAELTGSKQVLVKSYDMYESLMVESGLPSKLLVLCGEDVVDNTVDVLKRGIGSDATIVRGSPPFFVEVLHRNVCKGNGLRLMCEALGINLSEVIAFGDGDNDLEFVECAGHGVAMKNARESLKAVSDEICPWTNADDGVIRTLQRMEEDDLLHFPE